MLEELEKIGQFFQVSIHLNFGHPQSKMTNTSFCVVYSRVTVNKTETLFLINDSVDATVFFWPFKVTSQIRDTAPLNERETSRENHIFLR